ncbi:MAG: dihydrofolate reductase family protein [Desulfobacterales bacterium]|jgi:dihydrofolate reductase
MRKLIMWNLMTLDGCFEGANHNIDWHEDVWGDELEQLSIEQCRAAGALLFGRVTYELMANYWPSAKGEIADLMNGLPKVVASRTMEKPAWHNTQLIRENVPEEISRLKAESGKNIFIFGSAELSAGLVPHGLIDEFRICLVPTVLGGGTPLFKSSPKRLKLRLIDARPLQTGAVILRYQPT